MTATMTGGAIVRAAHLRFEPDGDLLTARAVGPHLGARLVTLDVVRVPAHATWAVSRSKTERVALVATGTGMGTVDRAQQWMGRASALYCPTGSSASIRADEDMTLYVWQHVLDDARPRSRTPRRFDTLWDDATQLKEFAGTGEVSPAGRRATMNFVFWPGTGSAALCLHCGIQQPGETFSVHLHQHSEDAFVAFEGSGQMYLRDRWVDVSDGDILFAPPTVLHGARNPYDGPGARRFVTCGGPTPFDTFLYDAAGLSCEVI
ncbi:cupin domain-containing protein [Streptomyces sp. NPDC052101]|uniref:cupin domain-containing protein n=1 Tax=Streptomyces sp. NPDC052101 TaxID=3155763 RepID=UPI00344809FD